MKYINLNIVPTKPYISGCMVAPCLDTIVRNDDLMVSCKRIHHDGDAGHSLSKKLSKIMKMTAVSMFLHGKTCHGQEKLDNIETSYVIVIAKHTQREKGIIERHAKI